MVIPKFTLDFDLSRCTIYIVGAKKQYKMVLILTKFALDMV